MKIKFRTKIEVFGAIVLCLILVSSSLFAVTRTITDSSDNAVTFIRSSNGNYWEATGANFITAVNSMNATKGKINLPICSITIDEPITFKQVVIEGEGTGGFQSDYGYTKIILTDDASITVGNGGCLRNLKIYCDSSWTADFAVKYIACDWASGSWGHTNLIENVEITNRNSWGTNGEGLNFTAIEGNSIALASFSHIHIGGFQYSLVFYCKDAGDPDPTFINGNHFYDMRFTNIIHGITIIAADDGAGIGDNKFFGVDMDPTASSTEVGIDIGGGGRNCFYGYMAWDWNVCPNAGMVNISNESACNMVELLSGTASNVNDLGEFNTIYYVENGGTSIPHSIGYNVYKNLNLDTLAWSPYYVTDEYGSALQYYDSYDPAIVIDNFNGDKETVHLSGETYNITNWLIGNNNITVLGDNKYNTILHPYKDVNPNSIYAICAMAEGGDNVVFKDITFDADQHRAYVVHNSGTRKYNWTFENCIFKGANDTYTIFWSAVSDSKFIDCDFYDKQFYMSNCENIVFERCNFFNTATDALVIYLSSNISVLNCKFEDYTDDGIYLSSSNNCLVSNNYLGSSAGDVSILLTNTKNCTIINNFVYSATGIDETGTSDYNIISCNNCGKCTTPIDVNGAHTIHFNSNIGTVS